MGVSASKISCGDSSTKAVEPSVQLNASPNTIYSLEFSGEIVCWKRKKIKGKQIKESRNILEDSFFWQEWLDATMQDATEECVGDFLGVSVSSKSSPPVLDIVVDLDPITKKNEITGVVSWRSISIPEKAITNAVEWRLGDRMCHYGIQNEKEKWSCLIYPGVLEREDI